MKKGLIALTAGLALLVMTGLAQASLTVIGTACYGDFDYKLIYDDDDTGHGGGGLVWLDYTHSKDAWAKQVKWASMLGSSLTVNLNPGYTTDIDWTTGWRLPDTVDGAWKLGYEGDPNNDGIYSYTGGYNLANSEMGHLFYTELGNTGSLNTDGSWNMPPPAPDYFLENTGDFENLITSKYWSGTKYAGHPFFAWYFDMTNGGQYCNLKFSSYDGLAVRSGDVSAVPLPGAIYLLGSGLIGLASLRRRKQEWGQIQSV